MAQVNAAPEIIKRILFCSREVQIVDLRHHILDSCLIWINGFLTFLQRHGPKNELILSQGSSFVAENVVQKATQILNMVYVPLDVFTEGNISVRI